MTEITISFVCDRCKHRLALNRDTWDEFEVLVQDMLYTRAGKTLCDECIEKFENLHTKFKESKQTIIDDFWKGE
jgi:hypothetical protein